MAMTIVEKILARAGGLPNVAPGDFVVVNVDTAVLFDNNFSTLYWRDVLKVADPDKIVVAFDHRVPAPDRASAQAQVVGRNFVKRFGIKRFHDIGRDQGISHVVVADNAYALPGTVLVCSDTHTGSRRRVQLRGARRRRARYDLCGDQGRDLVSGLSDDPLRHRGQARARRHRQGVFLHLANTHGDHAGQNIEFGGPGMTGLRHRSPPHHRHHMHRAQRRVRDLRGRRHRARLRAQAKSRAVHAGQSRSPTPPMRRAARSISARSKSWWRCPIRC